MIRLAALVRLLINFPSEALRGAWGTGRMILGCPRTLRPGDVRLTYGELPDGAVGLLAALVTLTPGTTVLEIDRERQALVVHLLDLNQADMVLAGIRRDFLQPLRALLGGTR